MTIKSGIKISFLLAVFVFAVSVDQTYAQKCEDTTNEQIVEYMYAKIKSNSKLASQISHINIISENRVVRFQGWVESENDYKSIESIALGNNCIVMINPSVKDFARKKPDGESLRGGMCVGETKPCGDICIPNNDTCNISGEGTK